MDKYDLYLEDVHKWATAGGMAPPSDAQWENNMREIEDSLGIEWPLKSDFRQMVFATSIKDKEKARKMLTKGGCK